MKRNRIMMALLCVVLVSLQGCYKADNAVDNALLAFQRIDRLIDKASEGGETIYCPTCATHLMSKDAALNWQYRCQLANKYEAEAYKVFKQALDASNKLTLTTQGRADIESNLVGIRGAMLPGAVEGMTSNAQLTLAPVLKPMEQSITALLRDLLKIKEIKGDVSVQLTAKQRAAFDALEAEIR